MTHRLPPFQFPLSPRCRISNNTQHKSGLRRPKNGVQILLLWNCERQSCKYETIWNWIWIIWTLHSPGEHYTHTGSLLSRDGLETTNPYQPRPVQTVHRPQKPTDGAGVSRHYGSLRANPCWCTNILQLENFDVYICMSSTTLHCLGSRLLKHSLVWCDIHKYIQIPCNVRKEGQEAVRTIKKAIKLWLSTKCAPHFVLRSQVWPQH